MSSEISNRGKERRSTNLLLVYDAKRKIVIGITQVSRFVIRSSTSTDQPIAAETIAEGNPWCKKSLDIACLDNGLIRIHSGLYIRPSLEAS